MDTIKMLIESLMIKNPLLTWTIFNEKNGNICVKMRFAGCTSEAQPITDMKFKRKSDSQINRDNRWAQQHQQRIQTRVDIESNMNSTGGERLTNNLDNFMGIARNSDLVSPTLAAFSPTLIASGSTHTHAVEPSELNIDNWKSPVDTSVKSVLHDKLDPEEYFKMLPEVYDKARFFEHLELSRVDPKEYAEIGCHSCDSDLNELAEKYANQAGLIHCRNCYLYICKVCERNNRHKEVCNFDIFSEVT